MKELVVTEKVLVSRWGLGRARSLKGSGVDYPTRSVKALRRFHTQLFIRLDAGDPELG
jgi:hypothetical protein